MRNNSKPPVGSLSQQLKPLAAKLARHQSSTRPVSQILVTLTPTADDGVFAKIRTDCLRWIAKRAGRALPKAAWDGAAFELEEVGAQRGSAVSMDSPRFWAARIDDADKTVAQRTWVTEIGLGQANNGPLIFGVRLTCVTHGEDVPYQRTIPGFVRPIIDAVGATLDGRKLSADPWVVSDEKDVDELVALLTNQNRTADVIVFALPEGSVDSSQVAAPATEVQRSLFGAAHVVVLTGPASFHLSDAIGKEFSVFRQGVRTYLPGLNPEHDEPFRHPLGLPARIGSWPDGGPTAYARMLVSQSLARAASQPDREQRLPSFATIRRHSAAQALEASRASGSSDKELLSLAWDEIAQLRKAIEEQKKGYDDLLATADVERDQAVQSAQLAKQRAYQIRVRADALQQQLTDLGNQAADVVIPDEIDQLEQWSSDNLSGSVEIHNRTFQGAKKSQYEDVPFIYRVLLLLRDHYVPMRRNGGEDMKNAYDIALRELGLEESGSISGERLGEQGDTYIVMYAGRRRVLDRHLKKGSSKEQRVCFRLYFFWDEDSEQAVVGWLPSHLDTRAT